jgi:hypothetical protein
MGQAGSRASDLGREAGRDPAQVQTRVWGAEAVTVALLAIVTAFGVTYLRGEWRDAAAHDAAVRQAGEAEAKGVEIPF